MFNSSRVNPEERIQTARSLCEGHRWVELLPLTESWQAENSDDAKALFYRGVALAALGRFIEAETVYRQALEKDPKDFKIWNNLAGILFDALRRPKEAIYCMEQALQAEPQNKLGWANLASMFGELGNHQKAMELAERALALDPEMVEAQLHRAAAAKALGKMEVVKEVCERLAAIEPEKFRRVR